MITRTLFLCALLFSIQAIVSCDVREKADQTESTLDLASVDETKELSKELKSFITKYPVSVVLSDKGCVSCNRKLVEVTRSQIQNNHLGLVLEASGRVFDISSLIEEDISEKVIADFKCQLSKKLDSKSSFILFPATIDGGATFDKFEVTISNIDQVSSILKEKLALIKKG